MPPAPGDTSVKSETLDSQERQADGSTSSPPLPPPSVTVKAEVKKEEPEEENGKGNDEEEDDSDRPCTKMTMRLRRNISNPQCVSRPKDAPRWPTGDELSVTEQNQTLFYSLKERNKLKEDFVSSCRLTGDDSVGTFKADDQQ